MQIVKGKCTSYDMDTTNHTELDPLAPRIEEALLLSGMSATRFGYLLAGDSAFIPKMRKGRTFRRPMIEKIEAFLAEQGL